MVSGLVRSKESSSILLDSLVKLLSKVVTRHYNQIQTQDNASSPGDELRRALCAS